MQPCSHSVVGHELASLGTCVLLMQLEMPQFFIAAQQNCTIYSQFHKQKYNEPLSIRKYFYKPII